jgi:hypothetical protein
MLMSVCIPMMMMSRCDGCASLVSRRLTSSLAHGVRAITLLCFCLCFVRLGVSLHRRVCMDLRLAYVGSSLPIPLSMTVNAPAWLCVVPFREARL